MSIEKGMKQEFPLDKITRDYSKLSSTPEPSEVVQRVQPQAVELEIAVLSSMLIDPDCIPNVVEILRPECFYKEEHQIIYKTIVNLFESGKNVDLYILTQELRKNGLLEKVGGAAYLTEISNAVATSANVEEYAQVVHDKYVLRELIKMSNSVASLAYKEDTDAFDLLDLAERKLLEISAEKFKSNIVDLKTSLREVLEKYETINRDKIHLTGITTGFPELDALTGGLQKSDLIIIAGRPSMGKTAFALSIARNAAVEGKVPVAIFSLEMSVEQLTLRLICMEANVDMHALRTGRLSAEEWQRISSFIGRISNAPIFIDDTPALSTLELRAKARRLKAQHDIGLIVVDYLQLMHGVKAETREREISMISRSLKSLAKELDVPVVALSQLRRAVEERGDKRPMLSDLRESGCLTGDTLIIRADTGERVPIKDLVGQTNIPIFSVGPDFKLHIKKITKVFYSGRKVVYELKTRSGRKIKASANHPFLRIDGWKRLDELNIGDYIALPRVLVPSNPPNPLSDDELILLAHLLGDGCILPNQPFHYTSKDLENIEIVKITAKKLFNIEGRVVKQKNWYHLYLPSPYHLTHKKNHPITIWFKNLGLQLVRSYEKKIPEVLFQCDENKISLFLRHLWSTDGNLSWKFIPKRKPSADIYYSTSSPIFAEQVQSLLLRLGIQSTLREVKSKKGYRPIYHVYIESSQEKLKFLYKVGIFGEKKKLIFDLINALQKIEPNPNVDIIPKMAWNLFIEPAKEKIGIGWRKFCQKINTAYCGSTLFKHNIGRERMLRIAFALENTFLHNLATSDIFWDKVVSIKKLGIEDVYDATVEETHNFIANDIIVHNSLEQDADVVIFVHRPEYYGITAYDDGTPTEGTAEIIISKQRNGPIGTIRLGFLKHSTKFVRLELTRRDFEEEIRPIDKPIF